MVSGNAQRQKIKPTGIDTQPFDQIIIVARPKTAATAQNLEIHPATTARAGFNLDIGMRGAQPVKQGIERDNLRMAQQACA